MRSPLSMNFGRISTSKCKGKLQKMGVLYTHSPKSPGPFPNLPKILFFIKNFSKKLGQPDRRRCQPAADGRPLVAGRRGSTHGPVGLFPFFLNFFLPTLHLLRKWSTLFHWLQHMPPLPRLLLETSNIHNF
jgi:hypothetical protein